MSEYSILKVPVSREKQVFYYFKRYQASDKTTVIATPPPSDRSLYVVHFEQMIQESFLLRIFQQFVGQVTQTHIGHFKPKASKKKAKRTLYFAIVVFKNADDLSKLLGENGAKFLQGKVNKLAAKQVAFSENPFLSKAMTEHIDSEEEPETEDKKRKRLHRETMEADGFTLVQAADEALNQSRVKVRDQETGTTIIGIKPEKAKEIWEQQQERKQDSQKYISGKEKKELIKSDFYMFQKRMVMKSSIDDLRKGFEEDKKRLQKAMEKSARKAQRSM